MLALQFRYMRVYKCITISIGCVFSADDMVSPTLLHEQQLAHGNATMMSMASNGSLAVPSNADYVHTQIKLEPTKLD